jgi:hypothetical protein
MMQECTLCWALREYWVRANEGGKRVVWMGRVSEGGSGWCMWMGSARVTWGVERLWYYICYVLV